MFLMSMTHASSFYDSSKRLDNWYTVLGPRRQRKANPAELYGVVDGSKHECKGVTGSDGRRYNVWIKKRLAAEINREDFPPLGAERARVVGTSDRVKLPPISVNPTL